MGVDELPGITNNGDNETLKGSRPGLARKLRQASRLPPREIRALSTFIDALMIKQRLNNDSPGATK